jgi:hypothetical protein
MRQRKQSRADRWLSAVSDAKEALDEVVGARDSFNQDVEALIEQHLSKPLVELWDAVERLDEVKQEYQEWYDNMPEGLQGSATGEKLEAITELDTDPSSLGIDIGNVEPPEIDLDLDEVTQALDEAESAELPVGFGRD